MQLRAWRSRGRLLVQCDACSSRGHPAVAQVTRVVDPKSAEARASTQLAANKLRLDLEGGVRATMQLHRAGRLKRPEAAARIHTMSEKHAEALAELLRSAPGVGDGVVDKLAKCPWCDSPGDATVEALPDDRAEPPEWGKTDKKVPA